MSSNIGSISRIFTKKILNELLNEGHSDVYDYVIRRYTIGSESKTNGELISEIYVRLGQEYRNEYYYTNTLLNKLLIGIHSVNTTTALSQVRVAEHVADFVLINGTANVYEIKSDLDNLERLNAQIVDYYKAFSRVSVLASEYELMHVKKMLSKLGKIGEYVGIYVLSERNTIFNRTSGREPKEWNNDLEYKPLFNLLRKNEYEMIIREHFGNLPQVQPVFYYKECLKKFSEIPIQEAQRSVFCEIKKRNKITKTAFQSVPNELRSIVYFSDLSKRITELTEFLQRQYQRG